MPSTAFLHGRDYEKGTAPTIILAGRSTALVLPVTKARHDPYPHLQENLQVEGLLDVSVSLRSLALDRILGRRAKNHNDHAVQFLSIANETQHLHAVPPGNVQVKNDDIRTMQREMGYSGFAVANDRRDTRRLCHMHCFL